MGVYLPPEIWVSIANRLPKKDLLHLCQTSQELLRVIRPILFRDVEVKRNWDCTCSLLASNKELAESVRNLYLRSKCPGLFEAMANMSNIELVLIDDSSYFTTAEEQESFVRTMSNCTSPILGVTIGSISVKFPQDNFSIPNLTFVLWSNNYCEYKLSFT